MRICNDKKKNYDKKFWLCGPGSAETANLEEAAKSLSQYFLV